MNMTRAKASLLAVLVTAVTCGVLLNLPGKQAVEVRTAIVQRGEVVRTVKLSGIVGYRHNQLCVNMQEGRLAEVYVQPGQAVKEGELLFRMDTSVQEAALARLYSMRNEQNRLLASAEASISALAAQQELLWTEQEASLQLAIEAAFIRADRDGVVETIYLEENTLIPSMTPLGKVRGEERCIEVAGMTDETVKLLRGAVGTAEGMAVQLDAVASPDMESGIQQLTFVPVHPEALAKRQVGERITVEAVLETVPDCVPIPLSAIDRQSRVWYVENGRACFEKLETLAHNREAAAAPLSWEGRRIILEPEGKQLAEGCEIREARR